MRIICQTLVFAVFLSVQGTVGQTADRESFDKKLYSAVMFSHFGTGPKQFASLSVNDREKLLACRDTLVAFFNALDQGQSVSHYVTPELARKYRDGADLIDAETSIMQIGVFDWNLSGEANKVDLRFFSLTSSEGEWILSKNVATFEMNDAHWHIVAFRWKEK